MLPIYLMIAGAVVVAVVFAVVIVRSERRTSHKP